MAKVRRIEGAVAPLFDRLRIAKSPNEPQPLLAMDLPELRESVRLELVRLFNVRSRTPEERYAEGELTVVDYGVPDFTAFSPQSGDDRARLAQGLARAVTAFEPRLRAVEAAVEADA